jgi:hypothetical protein
MVNKKVSPHTTREQRDGLVADKMNKQKFTLKKLAEDANAFEDKSLSLQKELDEARRPRVSNPNVTCIDKRILERMQERLDSMEQVVSAAFGELHFGPAARIDHPVLRKALERHKARIGPQDDNIDGT